MESNTSISMPEDIVVYMMDSVTNTVWIAVILSGMMIGFMEGKFILMNVRVRR